MSRRLPLTKGKHALVDERFYLVVRALGPWHFDGHYPATHIGAFKVRLHVLVAKLGSKPTGKQIDHKDRDPLNNQLANLRPATRQQQRRNQTSRKHTSLYKGVSWAKREGKWRAAITIDRRQTSLGYFNDEQLAAKRYDRAARQHFGEFAVLNFPGAA